MVEIRSPDLVDLVGEYFQQSEFYIRTRQLNLYSNQKMQYQSKKHQKTNNPRHVKKEIPGFVR